MPPKIHQYDARLASQSHQPPIKQNFHGGKWNLATPDKESETNSDPGLVFEYYYRRLGLVHLYASDSECREYKSCGLRWSVGGGGKRGRWVNNREVVPFIIIIIPTPFRHSPLCSPLLEQPLADRQHTPRYL